jgi:hypothetical protein
MTFMRSNPPADDAELSAASDFLDGNSGGLESSSVSLIDQQPRDLGTFPERKEDLEAWPLSRLLMHDFESPLTLVTSFHLTFNGRPTTIT